MLVLGISGAPFLSGDPIPLTQVQFHDAAAVLLDGAQIRTAVEEERLNRIKHTHHFPEQAIRFCLEDQGIQLEDLARINIAVDERAIRRFFNFRNLHGWGLDTVEPRELYRRCFQRCFGADVGDRLHFVRHHHCHAHAARYLAGWDRGLLVTLDGYGDQSAGLVIRFEGQKSEELFSIGLNQSLGLFYHDCMRFIGYGLFEEGKVMALAASGDPEVYRTWFDALYSLEPKGRFTIDNHQVMGGPPGFTPRLAEEPLTRRDKDFAAALQEALETITLHVLDHFAGETGMKDLIVSGGVALNCALMGTVLYRGRFQRLYVPPAPNDSGIALGAACSSISSADPVTTREPTPYWGPPIEAPDVVEQILRSWNGFLSWRRLEDCIEEETATLLEQGAILGWAQGRTEFGPRALGNRSILADPRPAAHRDVINRDIKLREDYRPFAPVITREDVPRFFELAETSGDLRYMNIAARLKAGAGLDAVTHVDGTARLQAVDKADNPRLYRLLKKFEQRTGLPILLNTSFNGRGEPIVNSAHDALACFLTGRLDHLVIGDTLISRLLPDDQAFLRLFPSLPNRYGLHHFRHTPRGGRPVIRYEWIDRNNARWTRPTTKRIFALLLHADGSTSFTNLCQGCGLSEDEFGEILPQLKELWACRLLQLSPIITR